MNFSAEELRRLWLDLYRDEVARPPDLMDLTEYDPSALRARLDCNGPTGMASLIVARTMPPSPAAAIGTGQADTGNITISCLGDSGSLVPIGQRGAT